MALWKKNVLLIVAVVIIAVIPLIFVQGEYGGADGQAEEAITEINPDYEPWFDSVFELPSGEIESLLFCTQAAVGAGVIGFVLGRITAKPNSGKEKEPPNADN